MDTENKDVTKNQVGPERVPEGQTGTGLGPADRCIWKYEIDIADRVVLYMPRGSTVLSVAKQRRAACVWVEVTPGPAVERRTIYVRGTGHPMGTAKNCRFIGTVLLDEDRLVFHFFDGGVGWRMVADSPLTGE